MTNKQLATEIAKINKAIGKQRDALRDLISDAEELLSDADLASEQLDGAVECLSRLA